MASYYVKSGAAGAADGSTWADAFTTLAAAVSGKSAGDIFYVSHQHSESTAAGISIVSPGTAAAPCLILCVNDGAAPPTAMATTAVVTTTGTSDIEFSGFGYVYGITFNSSTTGNADFNFSVSSAVPGWWKFENCVLNIVGTGTAGRFTVGANSTGIDDIGVDLINTNVSFANTQQGFLIRGRFRWHGGTLTTGVALPTSLFLPANLSGPVTLRGVDLSALDSGKSLVTVTTGINGQTYHFEQCKLGASVTVITGSISGQGGIEVRLVDCDSGDTNYRYEKYAYMGSIVQESTIVRTGGASDGTTGISREMVTNANPGIHAPLESDPMVVWNEATGSSVTATVEVVTDNVTLTDKEAWIEVEYLGTSGFPLSSFANDRAAANDAFLGSGANQTSSSETWTTTGLTTPVKQKLSVSFTPQEKGPIKVRVMLAKASTTMYFDPLVVLS